MIGRDDLNRNDDNRQAISAERAVDLINSEPPFQSPTPGLDGWRITGLLNGNLSATLGTDRTGHVTLEYTVTDQGWDVINEHYPRPGNLPDDIDLREVAANYGGDAYMLSVALDASPDVTPSMETANVGTEDIATPAEVDPDDPEANDLSNLDTKALKAIAKESKIKGYGKMTDDELRTAISALVLDPVRNDTRKLRPHMAREDWCGEWDYADQKPV